jgi:alpha-glucosidase
VHWQPAQPARWRALKAVNGAGGDELPPYSAMILEKIA